MWKEPVIDRTGPTPNFTHEDLTRIVENINYLMQKIESPERMAIEKNYYIENDIVTETQWTEIITYVNQIAVLVGTETRATSETSWNNINNIEKILLAQFNTDVLYPNYDLYPGNLLYPR